MVVGERLGILRLEEDEIGEEVHVEMTVSGEGVDLDQEQFPEVRLCVDLFVRAVIAGDRLAIVIAYQY